MVLLHLQLTKSVTSFLTVAGLTWPATTSDQLLALLCGRFPFHCSYHQYMTASIPNGFSEEQLNQLMIQAALRKEAEDEAKDDPFGGLTREEICNKAEASIDAMNDICKHAMSHKLVVMQVINNYIDWHNAMAERLHDEGNHEMAGGWSRDAGKFQAILGLLQSVGVDPDDFTVSWFDQECDCE